MPTFAYTARDSTGQRVQGEITARTSADAARSLRGEGKFVVSITTAATPRAAGRPIPAGPPVASKPAAPASSLLSPRVHSSDVQAFAQQLSVMVATGVSLTDALETCTDPKNSPGFAQVLDDVIAQVRSGTTFSAALARHPKAFSPLMINMVKASEASGQLAVMLRRVTEFMTGQRELARKIKGAVAYPLVMVALAVGVLIFMMTFVLPRFAKIYAGKQDVLPATTRLLLTASGWMSEYGLYLGVGVLAAVVATIIYLRGPGGKRLAHRLKLALPIFGPLFHKTCVARSLRMLGTLIQSGVSILESVDLTRHAVGSIVYEALWADVHEQLQQGRQLSEAVAASPLMPRVVTKMLQAGERGGRLGDVMECVATHCEEEVATTLKQVTALIEPAIVMFVGSMVGGLVISLLLPIFTISRALKPAL